MYIFSENLINQIYFIKIYIDNIYCTYMATNLALKKEKKKN